MQKPNPKANGKELVGVPLLDCFCSATDVVRVRLYPLRVRVKKLHSCAGQCLYMLPQVNKVVLNQLTQLLIRVRVRFRVWARNKINS